MTKLNKITIGLFVTCGLFLVFTVLSAVFSAPTLLSVGCGITSLAMWCTGVNCVIGNCDVEDPNNQNNNQRHELQNDVVLDLNNLRQTQPVFVISPPPPPYGDIDRFEDTNKLPTYEEFNRRPNGPGNDGPNGPGRV